MVTFYFYKINRFNIKKYDNIFFCGQQSTIKETKINEDPESYIKLSKENYYNNIDLLKCKQEKINRKPIRVSGDPQYIGQSISGGDKEFNGYFDEDKNIIFFNASKNQTQRLIKNINKDFPLDFQLDKINVDFKNVISQSNSMIVGSWFNGINGKVKSVALFGDRVNLDEQFTKYERISHMSVLYLDLDLDKVGQTCEIAITKEGGIVLYSTKDFSVEDIIDFIYKNIFPLAFPEIR